MTVVRGVQAHEVHEVAAIVGPLIERGLARQKSYTRAEVMASLEEGRRQLFIAEPARDCILITEIPIYPGEKVLQVFLVAGKLPEDWKLVLGKLEQWAADLGCAAVQVCGRRGWLRKLRGYAVPRVVMRKELAHA